MVMWPWTPPTPECSPGGRPSNFSCGWPESASALAAAFFSSATSSPLLRLGGVHLDRHSVPLDQSLLYLHRVGQVNAHGEDAVDVVGLPAGAILYLHTLD